jgi:hypothetical protein
MNERRIEELAKQARAWAETAFKHQHEKFTSHWDNPVGYTVTQFFEQKFAELIVRECAQVCLEQRDPANLNYKPSERFAEAVKQHFGVEE